MSHAECRNLVIKLYDADYRYAEHLDAKFVMLSSISLSVFVSLYSEFYAECLNTESLNAKYLC